jgi:hypothetical protein
MRKKYDPAVQAFMRRAAKNLRKGARSKDPSLMWAVICNLQSVIDTYEEAAHEAAMKKLHN